MRSGLFIVLSIAFCICIPDRSSAQEKPRIPKSKYDSLMKMDELSFDQSKEGWRQFYPDFEIQEMIITDYIEENHSTKYMLFFHLGQIQAFQGKNEMASSSMIQGLRSHPYYRVWNYYVFGTMAFLKGDQQNLIRYTDSLESEFPDSQNLKVLKRLSENFDKTYRQAYLGID